MNIQFHIARNAGDPIADYFDGTARTNDHLELEGPEGGFVLNENSPNSLVFVAEGIGFASIKGLIEHAMALDSAERICLLWIASESAGHYLHNLCRAWNDALDNFEYDALPPGKDIVSTLADRLAAKNYAGFDYYICGGESLRDASEKIIDEWDLPRSQILYQSIEQTAESKS